MGAPAFGESRKMRDDLKKIARIYKRRDFLKSCYKKNWKKYTLQSTETIWIFHSVNIFLHIYLHFFFIDTFIYIFGFISKM